MTAAVVCERMHWDYDTYLSQPVWFVELLLSKWDVDAKNAEKARNRMA
jgi:hypothetical protein